MLVGERYADLHKVCAGEETQRALVHFHAYGAEDEVEAYYCNDLVDVESDVRDVEVHGDDDEVCNGNVRDVEDAVVLPADEAEGCRADGGKKE